MKHVDALNRHPVMTICDEEIQAIKEIVKDKSYKNYYISDDLLYKFQDGRDLLVIQQNARIKYNSNDSRERTYGGKNFVPKSVFGRSILYAI